MVQLTVYSSVKCEMYSSYSSMIHLDQGSSTFFSPGTPWWIEKQSRDRLYISLIKTEDRLYVRLPTEHCIKNSAIP